MKKHRAEELTLRVPAPNVITIITTIEVFQMNWMIFDVNDTTWLTFSDAIRVRTIDIIDTWESWIMT